MKHFKCILKYIFFMPLFFIAISATFFMFPAHLSGCYKGEPPLDDFFDWYRSL